MPRPSDTRRRLLQSAEAAFARDGFEGTSLRAVIAAAETNAAAIHYHFGDKEGLLRAVLQRRLEPWGKELSRGLAAVRPAGGRPELRTLLRALGEPTRRLPPTGQRLVARVLGDEGAVWEEAARRLGPVLRAYLRALVEARPDLDREGLVDGLVLVLGVLALAPHGPRVARLLGRRGDPAEPDLERWLDRAERCIAAGETPAGDGGGPDLGAGPDERGPAAPGAGPSWSELENG